MATHKGLGHDPRAKAVASHSGKDSKMQNISRRFFWQNINSMSKNLLRNPTNIKSSEKSKKHQVSSKTEIMQKIVIDVCSLPEVDSLKHLVFATEYFCNV